MITYKTINRMRVSRRVSTFANDNRLTRMLIIMGCNVG